METIDPSEVWNNLISLKEITSQYKTGVPFELVRSAVKKYLELPSHQVDWSSIEVHDEDGKSSGITAEKVQEIADSVREQLTSLYYRSAALYATHLPRAFGAPDKNSLLHDQISRLNNVFKALDVNQDGKLDRKELETLLRRWYRPTFAEAKELMAQLDLGSRDGVASLDELIKAAQKAKVKNGGATDQLSEDELERLKHAFRAVDVDKSGTLDSFELMSIIGDFYQPPQEAIEEFISEFDRDANQTIDLTELTVAFLKMHDKRPQHYQEYHAARAAASAVPAVAPAASPSPSPSPAAAPSTLYGAVSAHVAQDDEYQRTLVQRFRSDIERLAGKQFPMFGYISSRSQVVAGVNYYIKIQVTVEGECVHVVAWRKPDQSIQITRVTGGKTLADSL